MKKLLLYTLSVVCVILGACMVVAYHYYGKTNRQNIECTKVNINVVDSLQNSFVLADDVKKFISQEYKDCIGTAIDSLNLDTIEKILESKSAVLASEAHVTRNGTLNITVTQRKPIVRFIGRKNGYYADEYGRAFPLQSTYASQVQSVDGHIPDITDTVRIGRIVTLVNFIERSSDWRNKIVNISIDSTGNLTLIPRKGQEKFLFGQPDNIAAKMERMKLYYTSIIPATDSSRYTTVDLKYSGQIICK